MEKQTDTLQSRQETHRSDGLLAPPPRYEDPGVGGDSQPANDKEETGSLNSSLLPGSSTASTHLDGPDVEHPFAFPETTSPPSYSATSNIQKPLAVPQTNPSPDAGFVLAYPPSLLAYGIPESTWLSFISTLSSFLDATAGAQAIQHATKIAKSTADIPKNLGKNLYSHTVSSVKGIGSNAKRGNVFGIVGTVIGLPFNVVGNVLHSVFSIPTVIAQKPQTPRQRADVYVETANKRWFHPRRLHAKTMSTAELTRGLGVSVDTFSGTATTQQKLNSLTQWIGELKVEAGGNAEDGGAQLQSTASRFSGKGKQTATRSTLELGPGTLWLVLVQDELTVESRRAARKQNQTSAN